MASTGALLRRNQGSGDGDTPTNGNDPAVEIAKRLVVELSTRSARDLGWLVEQEELNKTTVVNRALQVYRMVIEAQMAGRQIALVDDDEIKDKFVFI